MPPIRRKDMREAIEKARRERGGETGFAPGLEEEAPELAGLVERRPPRYGAGEVLLGLYEVRECIGAGGMGEVWRVRHLGWGEELAMKEILPARVEQAGMRAAFLREAQTWVALPLHPHIVTAYYVREWDGQLRIFCEYVAGEDGRPGETVADRLAEEERRGRWGLPEREALEVGLAVAAALVQAHSQGLAHRDVKPGNVLVGGGGVVKLTDFGLAKAVEEEEVVEAGGGRVERRQMRLSTIGGGTLPYVSPEQARRLAGRPEVVELPSDVWSFGVLLWEVLTGARPWEGPVAPVTVRKTWKQLGVRQRWRRRGLRRLVLACLQKKPQARPPMAVVREQLAREYQRLTRETPPVVGAVAMTADDLNNRALSWVDLGEMERGEALWAEALEKKPDHLPSVFNRTLARWRMAGERGGVSPLFLWRETAAVLVGEGAGWEYERAAGLVLARLYIERAQGLAEVVLRKRGGREGLELAGVGAFGGGKLGEAEEAFRRAVALGGDWRVRWNLAAVLVHQGRQGEAAELWAAAPEAVWQAVGSPEAALQQMQPGLSSGRRVKAPAPPPWSATAEGLNKRYSPDGRYAVVLGKHPHVRASTNPEPLFYLQGHEYFVNSVAFSPDGWYLASGSADRTVRLWEVSSGTCVFIGRGLNQQ